MTWSTMARQDSHISISSTSTGARGSSPMMGESACATPVESGVCQCAALLAEGGCGHSGRAAVPKAFTRPSVATSEPTTRIISQRFYEGVSREGEVRGVPHSSLWSREKDRQPPVLPLQGQSCKTLPLQLELMTRLI
jgi:hypothetical protein